ncbi:MAG: hypothetical protein E7035_06710 [Verrucomicrobiaceae bacterium]|nr:hypothetical protein [Verrucomicrobiaceae bacterium]
MKIIKSFFVSCVLFCSSVFATENLKIQNEHFKVEYKKPNVVVCDVVGKPFFELGKVHLYYAGCFGDIKKVEVIDNTSLRLIYTIKKRADVTMETILKLKGYDILLSYKISGPEKFNKRLEGITQYILKTKSSNLNINKDVFKHGVWTRVEGGTSYEKRGAYCKVFSVDNTMFAVKITGNHYYCRGERCTAGLKIEGNNVVGSLCINSFDGYRDFEAVSAIDKQDYAVKISTEKPFNIFEGGSPCFKVDVSSVSLQKNGKLNVKAYDFDGKLVCNFEKDLDFSKKRDYSKVFNLPADKRNIFFVDASMKNSEGVECFTRTNIAILPPHKYKNIETSRLGISGNFKIQDYPEIAKLWNRLGIRLNRSGDNTKTKPLGVISFLGAGANPDVPFDEKKHIPEINKILDKLEQTKAPWLEFGNEWSTSGKARRDMKLKFARAQNYAKWLRAIRAEMQKRGMNNVKIMSVATGGAGGDTKFYQMLYDLGIWDLMDAMCFHPGRGYWTADKTGGGWTYLGGVQNMKKKIKELGEKPLFLTEVYAACQPNVYWCDSYRSAADNLMLSVVYGYVEDIAGIFLFKFNDGISWDINGVNEKDREWHYGIMLRDFSPKPSMMACATVAEHLDGAKFVRVINFDNSTLKACEFSSQRGTFHVVYDRKDGYAHMKFKVGDNLVHKEPWINTWKSHVEHEFSTLKKNVYTYDVIGRERKLKTKNGKVKLTLNGSPTIVYGLSF